MLGQDIEQYCLPAKAGGPFEPKWPGGGGRCVERLVAESSGTVQFTLKDSGENVDAFRVKTRTPDPNRSGPLYLPIHVACCNLADAFLSKNDLSWVSVFQVFVERLPGTRINNTAEWMLREPNDYRGGEGCRSTAWNPDSDTDGKVSIICSSASRF